MADVGGKMISLGRGWSNTGTTVASADYGGIEYEGTKRTFSNAARRWGQDQSTPIVICDDWVCQLVRNVSTVRLLPKRAVVWAANYVGKRVDGYATQYGVVAGIVDPFWPAAGVPVGEAFWIIRKGIAPWRTSSRPLAECVWSQTDRLVACSANGSTNTTEAGNPGLQNLTSGPTGATIAAAIQNVVGMALTAQATSGQTARDVLVDVCLI